MLLYYFNLPYSSSVTGSHHSLDVSSPGTSTARCENQLSGAALDPEITAGILKLLRALADEKMTMVIVTHEIAFARNVADRVIFMDGGVIVEEGKPEDVIDNPKSERTKAFLQKMA